MMKHVKISYEYKGPKVMPEVNVHGHIDQYYVEREVAQCNAVDAVADNAANEGYNRNPSDGVINIVNPDEPHNLITSLVRGERGIHAPVIDFDFPCELVPSSTIGHYHFYIHKKITHPQMAYLMQGLANSELIERGYYRAFENRRYTSVRPIGRAKPAVKTTESSLTMENAKLKHENYMLTREIEILQQKLAQLETV